MDWRDLIDEERRRRNQPISGFTFAQNDFSNATTQSDQDPGFFGGIGNAIENTGEAIGGAAKAVGGFFGHMVEDIADTAETAVGGVTDVVQGQFAANKLEEKTKLRNERTQEWRRLFGNASDAQWQDPEFNKKAKAFSAETERLMDQWDKKNNMQDIDKELDEAQEVDPLKAAAASAETFLNVATLGVGGLAKGAVKQGVKQGAKMIGKDVLKETGEKGAKLATQRAGARTAGGAAKRIGQGAGEGALLGAGFGAIHPFSKEGEDATLQDAWQGALLGTAFGGALGGAIPLLSKDVRAGVRQMPKAARQGAGEAVEAINRGDIGAAIAGANPEVSELTATMRRLNQQREGLLSQGLSETAPAVKANAAAYANALASRNAVVRRVGQRGSIQNPFYRGGDEAADAIDDAMANADDARQQLAGEPLEDLDPMASNYINEQVAKYNTPDEYRQALIDGVWANNKKGQGVETWLIPDDYGGGFKGRGAMSNNSPFYQAFYREYNGPPTKKGITDMIDQELTGKEGDYRPLLDSQDTWGEIPLAKDIYQQLAEREALLQRSMVDGPPADLYNQFATDLGQPIARNADEAIPRPISARRPAGTPASLSDSPDALQRALARSEAETNNAVDFIDPTLISGAQRRFGVQQAMDNPSNPYEGMVQNLDTPALPTGEIPKPLSPAQAKRGFKKDGEIVDFVNQRKPGSKPIELPANVADQANIAVRQTPAGKVKPLAKNNAHITNDDVKAIRAIAEDDTSNAFTMTRTPEMNLAEALRKRGGEASKEFKDLTKFNRSIREHSADYTGFVTQKREFLEKFIKEYGMDGKKADAMRPYLEAKTEKASKELLDEYRANFGDEAAEGVQKLRKWWRSTKADVRESTNEVIKKYAGEDRMMGDLGESYVPRVYKSGTPGFRQGVLDVAHGKMDAIGGEKGLFNLKHGNGYLSKESESMGSGILRNSEGIPLNSEFAKPNTSYLSAAQKRTAKSPLKEMEDPLTSMMRYFEATGRAKYYTEDIARGQTFRDAIQMVNNETGNLRQMYKSFEDQVNAIAGKTARLDRPLVDSEAGAKFVNVASKLQSRVARSTILGSASSTMAQTGQLPLIAAENGMKNFTAGMSDIMRYIKKVPGAKDPINESALMKTRYPKYEDLFKVSKAGRAANKGTDVIAKPFRLVEHTATELAWRSSYRRALQEGLKGKAAVQEADRIAAKIVGERSPGARAALYESRALSPVTSYTLEVNQLYQVAKQYFKRDPKKAMKLVGAIWLYNQGYQAVTGHKLNADPIAATLDAGKLLTDQNYVDENGNPIGLGERLIRAGGRIGGEFVDATPLGGPVLGELYPERGFRIPFGGGARTLSRQDIFGDTNFGRYGGGTPLASGIENPLLLLGIPGMNQAQRSVEGLNAYDRGASVSPSGELRYNIEQSPENFWRSILFGQYGTTGGRDYLEQQANSLAGYVQ